MKTLALLFASSSLIYADLTKEQILEFEKRANANVALAKPLQLFTKGFEFKAKAKTLYAKDPKFKNTFEMTMYQKVIDKDTLYSSYAFPGYDVPFRVVVKYDSKKGLYKKFMVTPDLKLRKLRGVSIPNTRSVHWSMITPKETTVNIESYFDDKFIAKEAFLDEDGGVKMVVEFTANKSK